ncbi:sensor histidine kinase [Fontimonas sp. SYSU GA230001]|uniref:sensor histidine kinase n=1 Tax=Fontimonas sp. SYSU GA230001 TaxID=3142450 RepID=UPI0032B4B8A2
MAATLTTLPAAQVLGVSLLYLGLLFVIALVVDRRAARGRSLIASPTVYALSLAVYCTSWTFFGSVGLAATQGIAFLPTYLGPALMALLWPVLLVKCLRIAKRERITTIADFIASRYGKRRGLAALVALICVVGVLPYLALQLKAVAASFTLLTTGRAEAHGGLFGDTALVIALVMAVFTMIFGTRHLDATERHEGLVAAIAFESVVKLCAFLAAGLFVVYALFDGAAALFAQAAQDARLQRLWSFEASVGGWFDWSLLILLSMAAITLLPRQFQVAVVENIDESQLARASWLFPLYLLLINLFVLPLACAGVLLLGDAVPADNYVLALPMQAGASWLALLVFIGGTSAATGMIIVETTALATMISNDLVLPGLLHRAPTADLGRWLLRIRRAAILIVVLLGYLYFRVAGEARSLVSIGLISFAAVAQLGPAFLGGLYWRAGTRAGAYAGLALGTLIWAWTLLVPSAAATGWLPAQWLSEGPLGIGLLRPQALFGLDQLSGIAHGVFWSLLLNTAAYVFVSLATRADAQESAQAALFVDALRRGAGEPAVALWRGGVALPELRALLDRILGAERGEAVLQDYRRRRGGTVDDNDPGLLQHVESALAGAIGSASARVLVASIAREAPLGVEDVMHILDETSQVMHYSRELAARTEELRQANQRLRELDRLKDDFISTVTHELRTPLTSIRAFSEILTDNPDLDAAERQRYLGIITRETERLTRLINEVLDFAKLEQGGGEWRLEPVALAEVVRDAANATAQLYVEAGIALDLEPIDARIRVRADRDRLQQVLLNLLGNAVKFAPRGLGRVQVSVTADARDACISVRDNGPGIAEEDQALIFEKFRQGGRQSGGPLTGKPQGTGLGLPISRHIVERLGGRIWVESRPGGGATFRFTVSLETGA